MEALPLNRGVRVENQEHLVARGVDCLGLLSAAEHAQVARGRTAAVVHLHVVVGALLVRLQLKVVKHL